MTDEKAETKLERMHTRLITLGEDWSNSDHAASLLEETRKSVRAQLALNHLEKAKTMNKAELMAEADLRYQEHINAMVEARRKSNIALVNYKAAQSWIDMARTKEATRRAEIKSFGG